jgi:hypothetical protein
MFKKIVSALLIFLFILNFSPSALAQTMEQPTDQSLDGGTPQNTSPINSQAIRSNTACVAVGTPVEEKPAICTQPTSSFGIPGTFTFYCQGNPQWDKKGDSCSIGQVGCGPTSLAMIFTYFGDTINPEAMFNTYRNNNPALLNCSSGSFPGLVNNWIAQQPGYEVGPNIGNGALNATEAKKYISAGWLILASSDTFKGQRGSRFSHIFVVQDVDPASGTFLLRDPENCSYATGEEYQNNILQPINGDKVSTWKYAYPVRKINALPQPARVNQNEF